MRLEIAGVVLKRHPHGWVVGRAVPREIKSRPTEEMKRPQYFSNANPGHAVACWIGRVHAELGDDDGPERRLLRAISRAKLGKLLPSLRRPDSLARRARGSEGTRPFSERAGIARSTLQEIEAGRSDPMASTLAAILEAGGDGEL